MEEKFSDKCSDCEQGPVEFECGNLVGQVETGYWLVVPKHDPGNMAETIDGEECFRIVTSINHPEDDDNLYLCQDCFEIRFPQDEDEEIADEDQDDFFK